jgi:pre-rRNA-processing protein TSR1
VASVYGPVSMPPCPLLVFKETTHPATGATTRELVASGTLHAVDPDRIILKRIVLTGYPIRVKRRSAVVKHMFYNPEDVKWFKPAELGTKQGAAGHIRMPIGTHGLMKVRFNRVIQQSDTVCLALYKRVFPKFVESPVDA